ncbi:MAG TPA: dinitrogenase iron-molybdenum cofactor biosynthesis protein [Erysipelotrichaceae bacterium]|nr:dinitrogenase iron-molybdenum cofactor biosynthesis protein [Erysipelotrichaceae bacterium]
MIIAIPINEKNLEATVCQSFGRAPYFLFYNTETKECRYLNNSAATSQGGAGIKAAQMIADNGATVLLTPRCGENAGEVLSRSKITIYKSIPGTVQQNIDAFSTNELITLDDFHPGFHRRGR